MSIQSATLYVDGACKGNPGLGGWGVHIQYPDGSTQDFCGGAQHCTNNQMELTAAIEGLNKTTGIATVTVWTDSNYVVQGITQWIQGWKAKNWRKADGAPVSNKDLWMQLDQACQGRQIDWRWIKGHAGHAGNERADALANQGVEQLLAGKHTPTTGAPSIPDWLTSDPLGFDAVIDDAALDDVPFDDLPFDPQLIADAKSQHQQATTNAIEEDLSNFEPLSLPHEQPMDLSAADQFESIRQDQLQEFTADQPTHQQPSHPAKSTSPEKSANPAQSETNTDWQAPQRVSSGHRQLILDTETTGINPQTERVIEIGVIEMVNRKATGNTLHVYLNPEQPVGDSVAIHGITDEFLRDKIRFARIAQDLCDFLIGGEIIAHNASFDMNFLEAELRRCGLPALAGQVQVTDTLAMAKRKHAGQKNSLDALARRYEIAPRDRTYHGALLDAEILADVYLAMTGGQVTLDMQQDGQADDQPRHHRRFKQANLAVIQADPHDVARHEQWLDQLDKGQASPMSIWRQSLG